MLTALIISAVAGFAFKHINNIAWDRMWTPGQQYAAKGVALSLILCVFILGPQLLG